MRLARGPFWRLLAINLLVAAVVWLLLPTGFRMPWPGLEGTPLPPIPLKPIIAYLICIPASWLGARRLHDVGRPGWHAWLPLMAFACATFMPSLLQPLLLKLVMEAQANPLQAREIAPKIMIGLWLAALFVAAGSLRTVFLWLEPGEPQENRHGPVPAGAAATATPQQRPPAFVLGGRMRRLPFWLLVFANSALVYGVKFVSNPWAHHDFAPAAMPATTGELIAAIFHLPAIANALPWIIAFLYSPAFAAAMLRLHDRNQSGILSILVFAISAAAPFARTFMTGPQINLMNGAIDIVTIYLLFQCWQPGDPDENRYGPPPGHQPAPDVPVPTPVREPSSLSQQAAPTVMKPPARQGFGKRGL
jgi:uncharacterized membrane protein YhaH (DUF805 family)